MLHEPDAPEEELEFLVPIHGQQGIPSPRAIQVPVAKDEFPPAPKEDVPHPSKRIASTQDDIQALVTKLEKQDDLARRIAKLTASEVSATPSRWYDRPILVGFLGTVLAAIVPSATAINGCLTKSTELELDKQRLAHQVSSDYVSSYALKDALTQALNPSLSEAHRYRALRFLAAAAQDEPIREWAKAEYNVIHELNQLLIIEEALATPGDDGNSESAHSDSPSSAGLESIDDSNVASASGNLDGRSSDADEAQLDIALMMTRDTFDLSKARREIQDDLEQIRQATTLSHSEKATAIQRIRDRIRSARRHVKSDFQGG